MRVALICLVFLGCRSSAPGAGAEIQQRLQERTVNALAISYELASVCAFDDALAYLDRLSPELRSEPSICLQKAAILGQLGRGQESLASLDILDGAELSMEDRAFLFLSKGLTLAALKRLGAALEALGRARSLGADEALVVGAEGVAYAEAEQYEDAERAYRNALRADPELLSALFNLALLEARKGNVDEAIALLRHSWRAGMRDPQAFRKEPFLKSIIEGGKIDDLLNSPNRECHL